MANQQTIRGGASALPHIAPRKGRVRVSQSMEAAGELSLRLLERNGQAAPANVVRMRPIRTVAVQRSPEMLLALVAFLNLPESSRDDARSDLRAMAYDCHDATAFALLDLLRGRG